jgi:hypothetical protein
VSSCAHPVRAAAATGRRAARRRRAAGAVALALLGVIGCAGQPARLTKTHFLDSSASASCDEAAARFEANEAWHARLRHGAADVALFPTDDVWLLRLASTWRAPVEAHDTFAARIDCGARAFEPAVLTCPFDHGVRLLVVTPRGLPVAGTFERPCELSITRRGGEDGQSLIRPQPIVLRAGIRDALRPL